MNILPLVLVLLLILSVFSVEKMEKFKSLFAMQHHYQTYLMESERQAFNDRQRKLKKNHTVHSQRQLSFSYFLEKDLREKSPEKVKQVHLIMVEFMKELYGKAAFYKNLENTRPNFVEELLDELMQAADALSKRDKVKRIEDIQRLRLASPDLQEAFYLMLKGTLVKGKEGNLSDVRNQEKGYYSLLNFLKLERVPRIAIHRSSKELLMAIYGNEELVKSIIQRRKELSDHETGEATRQFQDEFKGKQRPEISDDLLELKITTTIHSDYD